LTKVGQNEYIDCSPYNTLRVNGGTDLGLLWRQPMPFCAPQPNTALHAYSGGSQLQRYWYAIQTKTRLEKTVETLLVRKGYETFLPLYKVRRQWSDRIKEQECALFPGYLFSRLVDGQRWLPILTTPYVREIVGIAGRPVPVPDHEIEAVHTIVASGLPACPWPFLKVGQKVRIVHGPLADMEGLLVMIKKQHRLVISVEMLQRSVAVHIDMAWVRPAT